MEFSRKYIIEIDLFIGIGLSYLVYNDLTEFIVLYATLAPIVYKNDLVCVYPIFCFGGNLPIVKKDLADEYYHVDLFNEHNGYWGIGVGIEFKGFLVELMYGVNYYSEFFGYSNEEYNVISCVAYRLNIGYKFKI